MTPIARHPTTGTVTPARPRVWSAGEAGARDRRWKKKTFVKKLMSANNAIERKAPRTPRPTANPAIGTIRREAVKSPRPPARPSAAGFPTRPPARRRFEEHRRVPVGAAHRLDERGQ